VPLTYFIFVILFDVRLDSGSRPHRVRRRGRTAGHGDVLPSRRQCDPPPDLDYHAVRSVIVLIGGMLGGRGRCAVAPAVRGRFWPRRA